MTPVFLTLDEVLALHADQIERYGGALGIRSIGMLESALAMPQATFNGQFLHATLPEMAAAHLFHIVQNHPFVDGNKRAGLIVTIAFLGLNDWQLHAEADELTELVMGVASSGVSKAQIAVFLEGRVRREGSRTSS